MALTNSEENKGAGGSPADELQNLAEQKRALERQLRALGIRLIQREGPSVQSGQDMPGESSHPQPTQDEMERAKRLGDPSSWSPKSKKLIEKHFPESTKEERIRRANERPPILIGEGLTLEEVRYFAEDIDLEYDV
jgi:hypothetical protein